ncbi:MAG: class I SAM-dependent methyltransferase [Deltaproteobacteria bacterium]|nr:class I SAM-dependent methyltransferase [Deltaproteobacteria bacterium]
MASLPLASLVHDGLRRGSSLAYRAQQRLLVQLCGLTQRTARRVLLHEREDLSRAEFTALRERYDALLRRDLANVQAGVYPRALLFGLPWQRYARALPGLVRDVPAMVDRKQRDGWRELPAGLELRDYPPYYRRTFHWQTDGYLSRRSAELYDVSVEFLFGGTADVMRRQCLVPLHSLAAQLGRPLRVLDVGCGTGRTLAQIRRAMPQADLVGLDLSRFYLDVAREQVDGLATIEASGERIPLPDASVDAVVSVFVFHELPRAARRTVWAEARRVLRPHGRFVVIDSVQHVDSQEIAYFVDRFSREMHEPFYPEYLRDDLREGLSDAGFEVEAVDPIYLAKLVTARPMTAATPGC